MTWVQRYRVRNYIRSSVWVVTVTGAVLAVLFHRVVWQFDLWARWELSNMKFEMIEDVSYLSHWCS